jgi:hypothetical protein
MSRYKKGTKKPPVIVEVAVETKNERPLPPNMVRTYHPRKGWIIREVTK